MAQTNVNTQFRAVTDSCTESQLPDKEPQRGALVYVDSTLKIGTGTGFEDVAIPSAAGFFNYKGTWDAATNTPELVSSVGTSGDVYIVSVEGDTSLDGIDDWHIGDLCFFANGVWNQTQGANSIRPLVYVRNVKDLPNPSGGWHTLADNTLYKCIADEPIELGTNGIKFGENSHIVADAPAFGTFLYTGTGVVFDNNTNALNIDGAVVVAPTGTFVDFNGQSQSKLLICKNLSVFVETLGTIKDADVAFINNFLFEGFTDGFTFEGNTDSISISIGRFRDYPNTALDLGDSVNIDLRLSLTTFAEGVGGSVALSGLVDSGNITNRALVDGCIFNGLGDALSGITNCDLKWTFQSNTGKPETANTTPDAILYIADGDEIETDIPSSDTIVVVDGDWTTQEVCRFETDISGKVTYIGLEPVTVFVTSKFLVDPTGGSNRTYWSYIRKNGTDLDLASRDVVTADGQNPAKMLVQSEITFNTDDYIEIVIENKTNSVDVIISGANLIIG